VTPTEDNHAERPSERITDAEHAVMEALWDRPRQTAAEVCELVCTRRGWSLATVKTLLSRLVQKGVIAAEPDGRRFLYTPIIAREEYVGGEVAAAGRSPVWRPRRVSRWRHLAENEALSEADLQEIEALLKELRP